MKQKLLIAALAASLITCCSCGKTEAPAQEPDNGQNGGVPPTEEPSDPSGGEGKPAVPTCMVSFTKSGSTEHFNVAVQDAYDSDVWYVFRVNHYVDHSELNYMDLWRINWAYRGSFADGVMTKTLDQILTSGESESVFKDYGTGLGSGNHVDTYDFTGGYHGDERIDLASDCGITFYIDDKALAAEDYAASFDWVECNKFHYIQKSDMHKTALKVNGAPQIFSDHPIVAKHTKKTTFTVGGYKTENELTMQAALDFYWYHGICCIGTGVAEKGHNEDMTPVVTFDRSGPNRLDEEGKRQYTAWNSANGIEVTVTSTLTAGGDDSLCRMFIWDTANYAKYYRRYPSRNACKTSVGEKFASVMDVRFAVR